MVTTAALLATNSSTVNSAEGYTRTPVQTLDQGDFLNLLVAQMSQQDPMNPVKDTEFIAQMAQFSALEQSKVMQQDMAALRANTLLGNIVTVSDDDAETGQDIGVVDSVVMDKGVAKLLVNGTRYDLSDVLRVYPPTAGTTTPPESADAAAQTGSSTP